MFLCFRVPDNCLPNRPVNAAVQVQLSLTEQDRTELYISSLEKELLVCKTRERELVVDRADLVEKIRIIHGILEDKQKQVYVVRFFSIWLNHFG